MRYSNFRAQGLFVSSGMVEAGCKTVIESRCKQSEMELSARGANTIISFTLHDEVRWIRGVLGVTDGLAPDFSDAALR
jgi:hypothetical protein